VHVTVSALAASGGYVKGGPADRRGTVGDGVWTHVVVEAFGKVLKVAITQ
jgi:hypothetical protein